MPHSQNGELFSNPALQLCGSGSTRLFRDQCRLCSNVVRCCRRHNTLCMRLARGLPEPQIAARELADRRTAHQFHVTLDFGTHQAESALHTGLAGGGQG
jgi:hypothetical protein